MEYTIYRQAAELLRATIRCSRCLGLNGLPFFVRQFRANKIFAHWKYDGQQQKFFVVLDFLGLTFSEFSLILSVVEFLPLVSDVPARAVVLADGVRPPLSLIIQALLSIRVLFLYSAILFSELRYTKINTRRKTSILSACFVKEEFP